MNAKRSRGTLVPPLNTILWKIDPVIMLCIIRALTQTRLTIKSTIMFTNGFFIPYAFTTVTADDIKDVIENKERLGVVERVDIVERVDDKSGKPFNMAYIHMKELNADANTMEVLHEIKTNGKKTIYYKNKNKGPYWSLVENTYKNKNTVTKTDVRDVFPTPPKLVRNDAQRLYTSPEMLSRESSIGECPGAPGRMLGLGFNRELPPPLDLSLCFNSCSDCIYECCCDYETDGLVHESYVKMLEAQVAQLRDRCDQLEENLFKCSAR